LACSLPTRRWNKRGSTSTTSVVVSGTRVSCGVPGRRVNESPSVSSSPRTVHPSSSEVDKRVVVGRIRKLWSRATTAGMRLTVAAKSRRTDPPCGIPPVPMVHAPGGPPTRTERYNAGTARAADPLPLRVLRLVLEYVCAYLRAQGLLSSSRFTDDREPKSEATCLLSAEVDSSGVPLAP
jgi:hypothetical protein